MVALFEVFDSYSSSGDNWFGSIHVRKEICYYLGSGTFLL